MLSELSVIWISLSVIVLCWAVVRMNQKIDEAVSKYKHTNRLDLETDPSGPVAEGRRPTPISAE